MSLGRSSLAIASGTLVSRVTGLLRTFVLVTLIGSYMTRAGDAFSAANQLPNTIFLVVSAGMLTAVLVPQIVQASRHPDGGNAFISKILTLGTVAMLLVTAVAILCAPLLVAIVGARFTPEQQDLTLAFTYWTLPQLFFYGVFALVGETLNARGVYIPYAWAPIVNNIVTIGGSILMIAVLGGDHTDVEFWTPGLTALLGGLFTGGVALQTVVLLLFWRKTGLRFRPDFRWRGIGLRKIGRLSWWTFLSLLAVQAVAIVQAVVLSESSGVGAGATVMQNALLIYMLPYSIIVLAIGTPLFTHLNTHHAHGRDQEMRDSATRGAQTLLALMVIATVALCAAAVPASRIFVNARTDATAVAPILVALLIGLIPLTLTFITQRLFYIFGDTRTPFFIILGQSTVNILFAIGASLWADPVHYALIMAIGQSVGGLLQVTLLMVLLPRMYGNFTQRYWIGSLLRFLAAGIPAGIAGYLVYLACGGDNGWMLEDKIYGALGTGVIGLVSLLVYIGALVLLRAPEVSSGLRFVRGALRR